VGRGWGIQGPHTFCTADVNVARRECVGCLTRLRQAVQKLELPNVCVVVSWGWGVGVRAHPEGWHNEHARKGTEARRVGC
jgi:hypothetical protein